MTKKMDSSEKKIEIATPPSSEIIISSASKMNRIRDIGLLLAMALLFANMFIGWYENHRVRMELIDEVNRRDQAVNMLIDEVKGLRDSIDNMKK